MAAPSVPGATDVTGLEGLALSQLTGIAGQGGGWAVAVLIFSIAAIIIIALRKQVLTAEQRERDAAKGYADNLAEMYEKRVVEARETVRIMSERSSVDAQLIATNKTREEAFDALCQAVRDLMTKLELRNESWQLRWQQVTQYLPGRGNAL